MRRLIAILLAMGALTLVAAPAGASQAGGNGRQSWACDLFDWLSGGLPGDPVIDPRAGELYVTICAYQSQVVQRTIRYVPAEVANFALDLLALQKPNNPKSAPDESKTQLAGVRIWLWVDQFSPQSQRIRVELPGLRVVLRAEQRGVRWVVTSTDARWPNEVKSFSCPRQQTPYVDESGTPNCSHVLQHAGTYTAEVYSDWRVRWAASDGSFDLFTVSRPSGTPLNLTAEQRQAVIIG